MTDITVDKPTLGDTTLYPGKINALIDTLQLFVTEIENARNANPNLKAMIDALQAAINALQAGGVFTGTSATSVLIGTGAKNFTVTEHNRAWVAGTTLRIASLADPTKYMTGQVATYNTGTDALAMTIAAVNGAGTFADWQIGFDAGTSQVTALAPGTATADSALVVNHAGTAPVGVALAENQYAKRSGNAIVAASLHDDPMFQFMRGR